MSVAISDLVALGGAPATGDLLVLVDISDPTQSPQGSTKQMTVANLFESPTFTTAVTVTGTLAVSGNFAIATNKFTVTASSGRTLVGERLQIAGTTNAFPALRNTGATLEVILADASAFADLTAKSISATGGSLTVGLTASIGTGFTVLAGGANVTGNSTVNGTLVVTSTLTTGDTVLGRTSAGYANGAGAFTGTLTNSPANGNPTKWIGVNDNGTTRYVPSW